MRTAIYIPDLSGHPEVYARTISRILVNHGHTVYVFAGRAPNDGSWDDPSKRLHSRAGVSLNFLGTLLANNEVAPEILEKALVENKIDRMLMVDADGYRDYFLQMVSGQIPRFSCWTSGIFSRTAHWYPGEPFYYTPAAPLHQKIRSSISRLKKSLLGERGKKDPFLDAVAHGSEVIDALLVKDERVIDAYGHPFVWMPEIFEDPEDRFSTSLKPEESNVARYMEDHDDQSSPEILLFYGTGAWYKGYEYFLKLAALDKEVMAIHIGRPEKFINGKQPDFDTTELRQQLLQENRLLETGCFASPALTRKAFSKIQRFVSFHRLTGSSGTVLQSIVAGKPVLTPESGLLGYRTNEHTLGLTYRPLDVEDLHARWLEFKRIPVSQFQPHLERYSRQIGPRALESFFTAFFGDAQSRQIQKVV